MKGNQGLEALAALCGGATKVTTKEEGMVQVLQPPSNPIMPPPPAVGVAPKSIPSTAVLAPSPPTAAGVAPYSIGAGSGAAGAPGASLAAAPAPAFPMVTDFSSPQFQQAFLAASVPGAPIPSPAAAGPAAAIAGPPAAAASSAVSALLSAGLPPGFLDQTSAAVQQLAAYHYIQAQAQAAQQAAQQITQPPAPPAAQVIQVAPQQPPAAPPPQPPAPVPPVNLYGSPVDPKAAMPHAMPPNTAALPAPAPHSAQQPQDNSPVLAPLQPPKAVAQPELAGGIPGSSSSISPVPGLGGLSVPVISPQSREAQDKEHVERRGQAESVQDVSPRVGPQVALMPLEPSGSPTTSTAEGQSEEEIQPAGPGGPLAAVGAEVSMEDKKLQKRAANRRSAQLSRKRKKKQIEELKIENDELRRKEQILRSLPDLVVVFDSAGRLWFVSHSVSRFLDYTPQELEAESFWERLCDESVRLLKAAFMDALAARSKGCETTPLGSGVWELRLVDRDGTHKLVTLNGVVHFSGDAPECVCSIRPRDDNTADQQRITHISATEVLQPAAKKRKPQPYKHLVRNSIKPQQSVISNASSDDASVKIAKGRAAPPPNVQPAAVQRRPAGNASRLQRAAQISDGDSSIVSESGSDP